VIAVVNFLELVGSGARHSLGLRLLYKGSLSWRSSHTWRRALRPWLSSPACAGLRASMPCPQGRARTCASPRGLVRTGLIFHRSAFHASPLLPRSGLPVALPTQSGPIRLRACRAATLRRHASIVEDASRRPRSAHPKPRLGQVRRMACRIAQPASTKIGTFAPDAGVARRAS